MKPAPALLALTISLSAFGAAPMALQPLGEVNPDLLDGMRQRLQKTFVNTVNLLPPQPLPAAAYYSPRKRYRGTLLLDHLAATAPREFSPVLGITSQDISVTKGVLPDWGVFGVAYLSHRTAVISTFRLTRGKPSPNELQERLEKVAVHEIGHTLGLDHCPNPGCVMADACGTIRRVDASQGQFCATCARQIRPALRPAP